VETRDDRAQDTGGCCAGGALPSAGCGCEPRPPRRRWIGRLIFAAVMLAALAVGALALRARSAAGAAAERDCAVECAPGCCGR